MKHTTLAYLAVISACIFWGMNGVFANILHLPPFQQSFFRLLVPGLVTGGILLFQYKKKNISFIGEVFQKHFIIISLVNAIRILLLMSGYVLATVGSATVAIKTSVLFTAIFAFILLWESFTKTKFISLFIGFTGLLFIAAEKGISLENYRQMQGIGLIVLSAILWWLLNALYKKHIAVGGTMLIFQQSFFGMVIFGIISSFLYTFPTGMTLVLAILHSALIGVIWFYLLFFAVKYLEISVTSILGNFEILSAMLFGYLFLNQVPTMFSYIGMICIIVSGVILIQNTHKQRKILANLSQE